MYLADLLSRTKITRYLSPIVEFDFSVARQELIEDEDEDEAASVSSPNQPKPKKSKKKGKKGKKGKKARQG